MEEEENISKLCLFCASTCVHPTAQVVPPPPVERELFITPDLDILPASTLHPPQEEVYEPTLSFEGDVPSLQSNLEGFFILQKILKLPQSSLLKVLSQNDGDFHPERWTKACEYCSVFLRKHQESLKEIAKLERILTEIEIELKGRIVSSKDNLGGNSDWVQIRREVLNDYLSATETIETEPAKCDTATATMNADHHPFFDEESGPSHQDYDEIPIDQDFKIFVENLYGEGNMPEIPNVNEMNSPRQPPAQFIAPTIHDFVPTTAPTSTAPPPVEQDAALNEGASKKQRSKKKLDCSISKSSRQRFGHLSCILTKGTANIPRVISCTKCPYKTQRWARFEAHSKTHEKGSGGLPCEDCGIFMLPNKLAGHRGLQHNEYKRLINNSRHPNPLDKSQPNRRGGYYCDKCPFNCSQRKSMKKHEKAHDPGANPVVCGDCGIFVLPKKLAFHQGRMHRQGRQEKENKKRIKTFVKENVELTTGSVVRQEVVNPGDSTSASTVTSSTTPVLTTIKSQEIGFNQDLPKILQKVGICPPTLSSPDNIQVTTRSRSRSVIRNRIHVPTGPLSSSLTL